MEVVQSHSAVKNSVAEEFKSRVWAELNFVPQNFISRNSTPKDSKVESPIPQNFTAQNFTPHNFSQNSSVKESVAIASKKQDSTPQNSIVQHNINRYSMPHNFLSHIWANLNFMPQNSMAGNSKMKVLLGLGMQSSIDKNSMVDGSIEQNFIAGNSKAQESNTQNLLSTYFTAKDLTAESSTPQNSTAQDFKLQNSELKNSTNQNLVAESSMAQDLTWDLPVDGKVSPVSSLSEDFGDSEVISSSGPAANSCQDSSLNPSINPSLNPSTNYFFNPSTNPSSNLSTNPSTNYSLNLSTSPFKNPSTNFSSNPSTSPFTNPSLNPSTNPSANRSPELTEEEIRLRHLISAFYAPRYEEELERLFRESRSGRSTPDSSSGSTRSVWDRESRPSSRASLEELELIIQDIRASRQSLVAPDEPSNGSMSSSRGSALMSNGSALISNGSVSSSSGSMQRSYGSVLQSYGSVLSSNGSSRSQSPALDSDNIIISFSGSALALASTSVQDIVTKAHLIDILRDRENIQRGSRTTKRGALDSVGGSGGKLAVGSGGVSSKKIAKALAAKVCVFCRNNQEPEAVYTSHNVKDVEGNVTCPILYIYTCPICGASGKLSHTIKYCPYNTAESPVTRAHAKSAGAKL